MKKILMLVCIAITVSACKKDPKTNSETEMTVSPTDFQTILDAYHEESLQLYPLNATSAGDNRYNDVFPNVLSEEFKAKEKEFYTAFKEKISFFKDADLTESEQLSKAILIWECDMNLSRLTFREDYTPINQMWTVQLSMGQYASGEGAQPFKTVQDYKNWLKRVDGYLVWMAYAKERMTEGIAAGHVLPKSLIEKVLPQLKSLTTTNLDENLFYSPAKKFPDSFSPEDKKELTDAYKVMVLNKIVPAYHQLHDFMNTTYLEAGRTTSGIASIPNGEAYYNHQIKLYTTID